MGIWKKLPGGEDYRINTMTNIRRITNAKNFKFGLVALLVLLFATVGFLQRQAIYDQFYDWKLIPRPERLTELYFTDHTNLPKTYTPDDNQVVKFTVRNLEYRSTEYTYVVGVMNDDETGELLSRASGKIQLDHNQSKDMETPITITAKGKRAKVIVTIYYQGIKLGEDDLSDHEQSIHYWVEDSGAPNVQT